MDENTLHIMLNEGDREASLKGISNLSDGDGWIEKKQMLLHESDF